MYSALSSLSLFPNCTKPSWNGLLYTSMPSLSLKYTSKVHDRFLILDNREIYHVGASLKDLGKKCFAFTQLMDAKSMIKTVLETVWGEPDE